MDSSSYLAHSRLLRFTGYRLLMCLIASLIFSLTIIVYLPSLQNDFVNWDDVKYVSENPHIRTLNFQSLLWMMTSFHGGNWIPLTWLSYSLDFFFWDLNPKGYHLTNLILHGLNTVLVYFLLLQLTSQTRRQGAIPNMIIGSVTSLIFGLHPIHVESVVWVAERKDLLCGFFFFLTIITYFSYTNSLSSKRHLACYGVSVFFFILALLSKSMAVTLPLVLLLIDFYPLRRFTLDVKKILPIVVEKVPFFICSVAVGIIAIAAEYSGEALSSLQYFPLNARIVNAMRALVFYLKKILWPIQLVPLYPLPNYVYLFDSQYLLPIIIVIALFTFCLVMACLRHQLWIVLWLSYCVTLLPVLGIIQVGVHAAADRFTYLPSVAPFSLAGIYASWLWEKVSSARDKKTVWLVYFNGLILLLATCSLTINQVKMWKNSETLWTQVIKAFPRTIPLAHNNLGNAYVEKKQFEKAKLNYEIALKLKPDYSEALYNLGLLHVQTKSLSAAEDYFRKTLHLKPDHAKAWLNLGYLLYLENKFDEALSCTHRALTLNPESIDSYQNLGLILIKLNRFTDALEIFKKALVCNPRHAEVYNNIGYIYRILGNLDEAQKFLTQSIELNPRYYLPYYNLGNVFASQKRYDQAIRAYQTMLNLNPQFSEGHWHLGMAYQEIKDFNQALEHYSAFLQINERNGWKNPAEKEKVVKKILECKSSLSSFPETYQRR